MFSQCGPLVITILATASLGAAVCLPDPVSTAPQSTASNETPPKPAAPAAGGTSYSASFTEYGAGDTFGSGNCNTATAACGFYDYPGFNAAVSQNLFGVGPGAGAGPACGGCWQLTAETDSNGAPLTGTQQIVVKVNNLCPAEGNPLCSQSSLSGTNSLGKNVNFDLCKDDGAAGALFGSSGVGLALGHVTQVDCSQWSGSADKQS